MSVLSVREFHDEAGAHVTLEKIVWPNGPVCPKCNGQDRITAVKGGRVGLYRCGPCKRQFTVQVGTVFESSHVPLNQWLQVVYSGCAG
jgi:transposase-like protein